MTNSTRGLQLRDLPDQPGPRAGERAVLNYLRQMVALLAGAAIHHHKHLEQIMATAAEVQAKLDELTASTATVGAAIVAEIQQLKDALAASTPGDPLGQAAFDQLTAAVAALDAAAGSLVADDPAPTPAP